MLKSWHRGKRKDNGEWVEGYHGVKGHRFPVDSRYHKEFIIQDTLNIRAEGHPFYFTDIEVLPETVGRYTGYTDKNGKMIFEGDVIKAEKINPEGMVCYGIAKYLGPAFWVEPVDRHITLHVWFNTRTNHEVIGNIYDDPELISLIKQNNEN